MLSCNVRIWMQVWGRLQIQTESLGFANLQICQTSRAFVGALTTTRGCSPPPPPFPPAVLLFRCMIQVRNVLFSRGLRPQEICVMLFVLPTTR